MNAIEYVQSRAHRIRWTVRQLRSASYWRNHTRRLGARLGFYDAWLEYDLARGLGQWTWDPRPQWRRNSDVIALLKARAAQAEASDFLRWGDKQRLR